MMRWCESVGFKVLPMPPDGNCGFHAYIKLMTDAEKVAIYLSHFEGPVCGVSAYGNEVSLRIACRHG